MKKRIFCVLMIALMLLSGLTLSTNAEVITGRALDEAYIRDLDGLQNSSDADDREAYVLAPYYRIQYSLDTETGEMHIYCGEDDNGNVKHQQMLPYARLSWVPWSKNGMPDQIKKVYIEEGVQSLGRYSFYNCDSLEEIYLPHSIVKVNRTAVYQCDNLKTVYYAGNEDDFFYNILYDEVRNWSEDELNSDHIYYKLKQKIHYGESVWVICKNQDGEIFDSYTVGGYFVGDKYTITPKSYEGIEYTSDVTEVTGKFKKGDTTEYVFEYFCEHDYVVSDPSIPCGSFCSKCGCANPNPQTPHSWGEPTVASERGMLTALDQTITCTVCGASHSEFAQPYILYVGVAGASLVLAAGAALAIILPLRHRKKMRDMTW